MLRVPELKSSSLFLHRLRANPMEMCAGTVLDKGRSQDLEVYSRLLIPSSALC